ncbi:MAG: response regulator [Bacteroidota bacterium]|nr:response regulator [Bacteroidota bacterium]
MKNENTFEKVMIVEDEKDLCFLLASILKKQNFFPSCVNSITEAKRTLRKFAPKIIFVDNHLPDGSGADFIGLVKKLFPSTTIIMITAHDSPSDVAKAFRKGADYFISKPFNTATIKNMLNHITFALAG